MDRLFKIIQDYSRLFKNIQGYSRLFKILQDYSRFQDVNNFKIDSLIESIFSDEHFLLVVMMHLYPRMAHIMAVAAPVLPEDAATT